MKASDQMLHNLGLTADDLRTLARRRAKTPAEAASRQYPRDPYSLPQGVVVEILDPPASPDVARLLPQDISAGGIGALLRGWLAGGTSVAVLLQRSDSEIQRVKGRVVRCFSLMKDVYDIGVQFDQTVDVHPMLSYAQHAVED